MRFSQILFLIFLVLKLTHFIDWSWWWIFSPIWGEFVIRWFMEMWIYLFGTPWQKLEQQVRLKYDE